MDKKIRQYIGLILAIVCYYIIHEGAHLLTAVCTGVFREIRFLGLGVQIDVYANTMTDVQMGIFCLAGSAATLAAAYILVCAAGMICRHPSALFKACMYYITIVMLFLDPLYLSVLCGFFGGGDMNGISLLIPEAAARIGYGLLFVFHLILFLKIVLPKYKSAFSDAS